jgi:hypothetical protein
VIHARVPEGHRKPHFLALSQKVKSLLRYIGLAADAGHDISEDFQDVSVGNSLRQGFGVQSAEDKAILEPSDDQLMCPAVWHLI